MACSRTASVAVLLSTCNGEAFLDEQIASLAAQRSVDIELFVRDDRSTDSTRAILDDWARRWPTATRLPDTARLGPAASFLKLLEVVPDRFAYYAFCDQDDVWAPDKLERAVERLTAAGSDQPALYCSRVTYVDRRLGPLGLSRLDGDGRFEHLLFENMAFGNTLVMNQAARQTIVCRLPRTGVIMHDWWCALVVSALGRIVYDERAGVLYRQHGVNAVGAHAGRLAELLAHARRFFRGPRKFWPVHAQAAEFLSLYGDLIAPEHRSLAAEFVRSRRPLLSRLRYAASAPIIRNRSTDLAVSRLLVAAGCY